MTCSRSVVFSRYSGNQIKKNKTDCHDIAEILLKVKFNTITVTRPIHMIDETRWLWLVSKNILYSIWKGKYNRLLNAFTTKFIKEPLARVEFYNILQILVFLFILFSCPIGQVTDNIHKLERKLDLSLATRLLLMSSPDFEGWPPLGNSCI